MGASGTVSPRDRAAPQRVMFESAWLDCECSLESASLCSVAGLQQIFLVAFLQCLAGGGGEDELVFHRKTTLQVNIRSLKQR